MAKRVEQFPKSRCGQARHLAAKSRKRRKNQGYFFAPCAFLRPHFPNRSVRRARLTSASDVNCTWAAEKSWCAVDGFGTATTQRLARFAASDPVCESSKATAS